MPNTVIALKKSSTPSAAPVDLANGELAINYADGKLFYKHANGTIAAITSSGSDSFGTINANGTLILADTPGDILTLEAGSGVSIVGDAINDKITIAADLTPALTQANTARVHANAAFASANAGQATANAAFDKANSANITADRAFNHANAAFITANIAFANANTVMISAQAAFTVANAAFLHANSGYAFANSIAITANLAFAHANAAFASSNSVNTYSNSTYVKLLATSQTITGNVNIVGDLTLSGNTFVIDATRLEVDDPLIYLAANNYTSDIVDIGFIANYVNATGQNVHTGLYREHEDKMYYLFQGYDREPINNHLGALSNNMTLAVLNADLRTSNLILGGANAILTIGAAFNKANSTTYTSNVVISVADNTNAALRITQTGTGNAILVEDDTNPDSTPFVVDQTGRVGIGTTLPQRSLHVNSTAVVAAILQSTNIANSSLLRFVDPTTSSEGNAPGIGSNGLSLLLLSNATERARIDSSGNVLISRTDSTVGNNVKLDVNGGINASAVLVNGAPALTGGITSNVVISVADNTNAALRITQTGTGDAIRVEDSTNPDSTPFVVDANGNVGIGTSLPSFKLLVRTPALGADGVAAAGPTGFVALLPSTAGGNFNPLVSANDQSIIFYGGSSSAGSGTGNLIIAPWSTSSVGMKIDYNGNVLIGRATSTVGQNVKLDVNGAINASAVLINGTPALPNTSGVSFNGNLNFPTGNVTIGTIGLTTKLSVNGAISLPGSVDNNSARPTLSAVPITGEIRGTRNNGPTVDDGFLRLSAGGGTNITAMSFMDISGYSQIADMDNNIRLGTRGVERVRIDANGNVGIGTTSPLLKLDVSGSSIQGIRVISTDTSGSNIAYFTAQHGSGSSLQLRAGTGYTYLLSTSAVPLYVGTNSAIHMTFDASGNVGIGTTSTNYKLEVAGSFAAQTKSFIINHPTKPGMMLRYGSLEGPENGVYVRGRLDGKSIIELPDYWWNLIDESTITVNLTPIGRSQDIWVQSVSTYFIHLNQPAECFFTVFAERKDVDKLVVEY